MQVLFKHTVPGVGQVGEIRQVTDAYARNFLLPKKLVVIATPEMMAQVQRGNQRAESAAKAERASWEATRATLTDKTVTMTGSASSGGKLFAAIKSPQVIQLIEQHFGVDLRGVSCQPDHFKHLGAHAAKLVWPDHHTCPITITIAHA